MYDNIKTQGNPDSGKAGVRYKCVLKSFFKVCLKTLTSVGRFEQKEKRIKRLFDYQNQSIPFFRLKRQSRAAFRLFA